MTPRPRKPTTGPSFDTITPLLLKGALTLALVATLGSASEASGQAAAREELDWTALAETMVERMDLQQGERVMLLAFPGHFDEMVVPLRRAVMEAGGVDVGVQHVIPLPERSSWDPELVAEAVEASRAAYREMFAGVDVAVMMPGATSGHPAYRAMQDHLHEGRGRTIHFHWQANGSVFPVPGQPVPPLYHIDRWYQRAILDVDYDALAAAQKRFEEAMRDGEVRVTTPDGTDLRFRIGDRPVNRQDGDASAARAQAGRILIDREIELPAGAVRVAPLEETVHGTIAFPVSQWAARPVHGLTLTLEGGVVTDVAAEDGIESVRAEMERAGPAGKRFREFALGFNPQLAVPDLWPWVPYYGYGAGVVRLSLGDNSELGGEVGGGYVRWNFFTNATVTVGDEVWVRDGKLIRP